MCVMGINECLGHIESLMLLTEQVQGDSEDTGAAGEVFKAQVLGRTI